MTAKAQAPELPPIAGRTFPRSHPSWCDVAMHRQEWLDVIEYGGGEHGVDVPSCRNEVGGGFLPEVRRCGPDYAATRADQGTWVVALEQVDHGQYVDDTVVTIESGMTPQVFLRLLPGEAREVAAALLRAADIELFNGRP